MLCRILKKLFSMSPLNEYAINHSVLVSFCVISFHCPYEHLNFSSAKNSLHLSHYNDVLRWLELVNNDCVMLKIVQFKGL